MALLDNLRIRRERFVEELEGIRDWEELSGKSSTPNIPANLNPSANVCLTYERRRSINC
jgi:hypothetical protein